MGERGVIVIAAALAVALLASYLTIDRHWSFLGKTTTWQMRSNGTHLWTPTVLLISLDGLKPEYLTSGNLPTLFKLSQGIKPPLWDPVGILSTKGMIPVSPSLTFPNHWSLQTGLQPSSHDWWKGTPIWGQLEKLGMKTANLMWPGPPSTSDNIMSTYFQKYEKGWPVMKRFDKLMTWLDNGIDERPRFICGYVPDIDTITHDLGPDVKNKDVQATLKSVDSFISNVLNGIQARNATSMVNVIIVSDHGMTTTSNDRLIYLEDLLGPSIYSQLQHWDGWPNVGLRFPNESLLKAASHRLFNLTLNQSVPYRIASREELVELWKWDMTVPVKERLAELWILPDLGWSVTTRREMESFGQDYRPKGNHGYQAGSADMDAFFIAMGPSVVQSPTVNELPPFPNLEIHNLVMDMLTIPASDRVPNNGTHGFWNEYISTLW